MTYVDPQSARVESRDHDRGDQDQARQTILVGELRPSWIAYLVAKSVEVNVSNKASRAVTQPNRPYISIKAYPDHLPGSDKSGVTTRILRIEFRETTEPAIQAGNLEVGEGVKKQECT
ncbi:hypothetical protein GCM10007857_77550 [Bradyrhizobium iriomotense]|uniref:Uncharacterized protein n=1 Tax=Bradyrhizobium iriomotense TaxID=441950 RepID=A0ABQ6BCA9_9BRAD|nr:hypothetical protein GCM10007857_77550 [Bradyrhizobium iriomotense]